MSKIGEPKVLFLSLSSLQTRRSGFLLAESALFTLSSLLFVADSGTLEFAIAFFLLSYAFCHLADLRFSFFFPQFFASSARSPASSEPFNSSPAALQQRPRPAPRSGGRTRREHRRHWSESSLSVRRGFRRRFSSKRSTTARELRRGARGRCPRRGEEEEALRIDKDIVKRRA